MKDLYYRVYYDSDTKKFCNNRTPTPIRKVPGDSTESWYDSIVTATMAVESFNNRLKEVRCCKSCGTYFWLTNDEKQWFIDRDMIEPCRCSECRRVRKLRGNING